VPNPLLLQITRRLILSQHSHAPVPESMIHFSASGDAQLIKYRVQHTIDDVSSTKMTTALAVKNKTFSPSAQVVP
jgi:hypothetical protein